MPSANRRIGQIVLFLIGCFPFLRAESVTSVSCQAAGYSVMVDTAGCLQGTLPNPQIQGPIAQANSAVSETLQQTANDSLSISFHESVMAIPDLGATNSSVSQSQANASVHINMYTEGPVRPGVLQIVLTEQSWVASTDGFTGVVWYQIGPWSGECRGWTGMCWGVPGENAPPIPFELGTAFSFDAAVSLADYASNLTGFASGRADVLMQFRFFEADGVTPVIAYDPPSVPEVNSGYLVGLAGVGFLAVATRFRSRATELGRDKR